jgi:hypothetical protein
MNRNNPGDRLVGPVRLIAIIYILQMLHGLKDPTFAFLTTSNGDLRYQRNVSHY